MPEQTPAPDSGSFLDKLKSHSPPQSKYERRNEIARGGMGAIVEVWDEDLRRTLAMKLIHGGSDDSPTAATLDERTRSRFLEEAQITGQLEHPSIVPIHELGIDADGRLYYTMPLVEGRTLKEVFDKIQKNDEDWTPVRALGILQRACEALAFAHSRNVIHRDIKPENIMIGRFGEVYVMDWGLAKVLGPGSFTSSPSSSSSTSSSSSASEVSEESEPRPRSVKTERVESRDSGSSSAIQTVVGDVVGTPAYMPPEQARGQLDRLGPPADVYAMGAMLYQLIAGHPPHTDPGSSHSSADVLMRVIKEGPTPLRKLAPDTPEELIAICERAMLRDPEERYRDLNEMKEDLRLYLERGVGKAKEALKSSKLVRFVHGILGLTWWFLLLGALLIGALIIVQPEGGTFNIQLPLDVQIEEPSYEIRPRNTLVEKAHLTDLQGKITILSKETAFGLGAAIPTLAFFVFLMMIVRPMRKILGTLRDGSPFNDANVRRMRWLGFLFLALSVISSAYHSTASVVAEQFVDSDGISVLHDIEIQFTPLMFGLILLILAEVFRLGSELEARRSDSR